MAVSRCFSLKQLFYFAKKANLLYNESKYVKIRGLFHFNFSKNFMRGVL